MKSIVLFSAFSFFIQFGLTQQLPEANIEEAIELYTSTLEKASVLQDCGHALDGPASVVKEFENNWLDAMFYLTDEEIKKAGRDRYDLFLRSGLIARNHPYQNKVDELFNKLISTIDTNGINFRLYILNSQEYNAFSSLGGYMYVTSGLLQFVDSYDELAFVIGHEIAHQLHLHTQRKLMKITLLTDFANYTRAETFFEIASNFQSALSAPFDQIDEYEADKVGFEIAQKAGYDVRKFFNFFIKIGQYEQQDLLAKLTSTHPFAEHRMKCVKSYIEN